MAAAANPAPALPRLVPRGLLLRPAFLRGSCRSTFPPGRAPSIPRRGPRSPLPCTSKPRPSRTGSLPAAPASAQFRFCPRPLARSSKYSSAAHLPRSRAEVFAAAPGCAVPRLPPASPPLVPRCTCPVPPRFLAESCHPVPAATSTSSRRSRSISPGKQCHFFFSFRRHVLSIPCTQLFPSAWRATSKSLPP